MITRFMDMPALDTTLLCREQQFMLGALRLAIGRGDEAHLHLLGPSGLDWQKLIDGLDYHGLMWVAKPLLGVPDLLSSAIIADLKERVKRSTLATFLRIEETVKIAAAFDQAGIRFLMIKGVALSVQLYQDPARRNGRDIDILVAPEDFSRADAILVSKGYQRPDQDKAKDLIAGGQAKELGYIHVSHRTLVEVHDRLTENATLLPWSFEHLWADRELVSIGTAYVPAMNQSRLPLYLSVHGVKHCWGRLMWLNDLAALVARDADVDEAMTSARLAGLEGVMEHTFCMLHAWLGMPIVSAQFAATKQVRRMNRLVMRFHRQPDWYKPSSREGWRSFWQNSVLSRSMAYVMKRDWQYRMRQWEIELTSPADRTLVALPPRFTWLYLALRPFGWLIRRLKWLSAQR
jgi:Uncharacterised nucleotidyltransferase